MRIRNGSQGDNMINLKKKYIVNVEPKLLSKFWSGVSNFQKKMSQFSQENMEQIVMCTCSEFDIKQQYFFYENASS